MKRLIIGAFVLLAACDGGPIGTGGAAPREFMVIGGKMSFEQCRASGGLIIRDANTTMVACDPSVQRAPAPVDEFDNPTSNPTG